MDSGIHQAVPVSKSGQLDKQLAPRSKPGDKNEKAKMKNNTGEFVIKSNQRGNYFIAIHGFTPFYGEIEKAKVFHDFDDAIDYARKELFTTDAAFAVKDLNA